MRELPKSVLKKYVFMSPDEIIKMDRTLIKQVIELLQRERILSSGCDRREYEQMIKSNMRLVDENRMMKKDIKTLISHLQGTPNLEDEINNILEYYTKQKELDN